MQAALRRTLAQIHTLLPILISCAAQNAKYQQDNFQPSQGPGSSKGVCQKLDQPHASDQEADVLRTTDGGTLGGVQKMKHVETAAQLMSEMTSLQIRSRAALEAVQVHIDSASPAEVSRLVCACMQLQSSLASDVDALSASLDHMVLSSEAFLAASAFAKGADESPAGAAKTIPAQVHTEKSTQPAEEESYATAIASSCVHNLGNDQEDAGPEPDHVRFLRFVLWLVLSQIGNSMQTPV